MSIPGVGQSLVSMLEREYIARHGSLLSWTFKLASSTDLDSGLSGHVTMYLYRIDVDPTRRHVDLPPETIPGPERYQLSLELRFLLTAWGTDAVGEHQMLEECIGYLDRHAILSGDYLEESVSWPEGTALKVTLESLPTEDLMRIWDAFGSSYRLSVPYVVRMIRLAPVARADHGLAEDRVHHYAPGVP